MKRFIGYIFLTCAFALAGTSVITACLLTSRLGTFTITAVSLFFALLALLPLRIKTHAKVIRGMPWRSWILIVLQALFGIFLFRLLLIQGVLRTSLAEAGVLTGATPAITAMLAWLCLKEPVRVHGVAGIIGTVIGVALIQGLLTNSFIPAHLAGNLLVLGAAACESVFNTLSRRNVISTTQDHAFDPIAQTTLVTAAALALSLPLAAFEHPVKTLSALNTAGWLALLWYGWFVTALAFICWYAGIKRCPAHIAAAFSGLMPFTSMVLSVTLLGENAGWHQWAGAALVMLGIALIGMKAKPQHVDTQTVCARLKIEP